MLRRVCGGIGAGPSEEPLKVVARFPSAGCGFLRTSGGRLTGSGRAATLVRRMVAQTAEQHRLRALLDAGIALSSELSLDALLQKLVEAAAELTQARYAALGVIDRSGEALERFITHGLTAEERVAIGDPPHGRGILGVLIREATPLRLRRLGDDPRSVGFPLNHPPMQTFLGVPVLLRGVAYGNLYLTDKEGGSD